MTTTMHYTGELTVLACWCGMRHAVPKELREFQLRQHENGRTVFEIHCPLGHAHVPSGEGEAARLQRVLKERDAALARERAEHNRTKSTLRDQKEAEEGQKRRARNGVCPCCKRSFRALADHMKTKHPGYATEGHR